MNIHCNETKDRIELTSYVSTAWSKGIEQSILQFVNKSYSLLLLLGVSFISRYSIDIDLLAQIIIVKLHESFPRFHWLKKKIQVTLNLIIPWCK